MQVWKFARCLCLLGLAGAAWAQSGSNGARFCYKKTPQGDLDVYVNYPPGWNASDKRPAIVFFSGGAWGSSRVESFLKTARYLASRGMVTGRADYRVKGRHGVTPDKCVEDARTAVRWMRSNAPTLGVDPDRIVASGGSAGGHIAACTAISGAPDSSTDDVSVSCVPNALVLFAAPLDLMGMSAKLAEQFVGSAEMAAAISPLPHFTKSMPPAILFYGTEDKWFPQGKDLVSKAAAMNARVELYYGEGQGHGMATIAPWSDACVHKMDEFLASIGYLSGAPKLQAPAGAVLKAWHGTPK